jgi:hypothetical protein
LLPIDWKQLFGLEQQNHNPRVGGSSPSSATIPADLLAPFYKAHLRQQAAKCF